jgi:hypothetical protein
VQQDDSSSKLKQQQQQQQQHPTRLPHGLQMCGRPELYHLKQSCCYPSRKLPGVVLPGGGGVTSVVGACIHVGGARVAPPGPVLLPLVPVAGQLLFCWSVVCEPASRGAGRPGLLICTKAWGPCPGVWCTECILSAPYRVAREQLVLLLEPSCCCPGCCCTLLLSVWAVVCPPMNGAVATGRQQGHTCWLAVTRRHPLGGAIWCVGGVLGIPDQAALRRNAVQGA